MAEGVLARGVTEAPLTLVSAAVGYGKGTLVSAWLEEWDGPSAWGSLDTRFMLRAGRFSAFFS